MDYLGPKTHAYQPSRTADFAPLPREEPLSELLEGFTVSLVIVAGLVRDEECVLPDDASVGALAGDGDDFAQPGSPRRDQRLEGQPFRIIAHGDWVALRANLESCKIPRPCSTRGY